LRSEGIVRCKGHLPRQGGNAIEPKLGHPHLIIRPVETSVNRKPWL
jgi:hypothetical protein